MCGSLVITCKEQILQLIPDLDHVRQERDAFFILFNHDAIRRDGLLDEEDVDIPLVDANSHSLNSWDVRCILSACSLQLAVSCRLATVSVLIVLVWLDLLQPLQSLRVDVIRQVGYQVESVQGKNSKPATLLSIDSAVGRYAKVILSAVQEDAFDLYLLLLHDFEQVTVQTVHDEPAQLLNQRLADNDDVAMARQLQGIDLSKDFREAGCDLHLTMLILKLVHQKEVL